MTSEWRPRRFNKRPASSFRYVKVGQASYEVHDATDARLVSILGYVWRTRDGWAWRAFGSPVPEDGWSSREAAARQLRAAVTT